MAEEQVSVTLRLREKILDGTFEAGEHIREAQLAKTLGVSRTPVRLALGILEHEGLVSSQKNRGFTVRGFSLGDIGDAIGVRGTLEGMAARLVAEAGLARHTAAALHDCLEAGDALLGKGHIEEDKAQEYEAMNIRFHDAIVEAAGNRALANALSLNDKVPFAGAGAVAFRDARLMLRQFVTGHGQHHAIVEAIEAGEGARAEALMREHALIARKSLNLLPLGEDRNGAARVPGLTLVRG